MPDSYTCIWFSLCSQKYRMMNLIELYLISEFYSQIWLNLPSKEVVDYIENVSVDY
jgi:hypothetical protein